MFDLFAAAITPVIACGAFADRARLGPILIFVFCWSTIVYNRESNAFENEGDESRRASRQQSLISHFTFFFLPSSSLSFNLCSLAAIANWTWNVGIGWANVMGGLDFAGGSPVHISSGTAALAISLFLGRRKGYGTEQLAYRPQNASYVILGTVLLWFGWMGFNGGEFRSE